MSERQLLGYLPVDSGQISIVDPAHIELVEKGDLLTDLLTVDTKIDDETFQFFLKKMMPKEVMESHELLLN